MSKPFPPDIAPYQMSPHWLDGNAATDTALYRNLLRVAAMLDPDDLVEQHLANYKTAYQLSLDCNLPGDERAKHKATAKLEGFYLASRLSNRLMTCPVLPDFSRAIP